VVYAVPHRHVTLKDEKRHLPDFENVFLLQKECIEASEDD
jgi:hypothetical protein